VTLLNTVTGEERVERFALVVGADGVRSTVRKLVFGPPDHYLNRLGRITPRFSCPSRSTTCPHVTAQ
jgi:2-polyprenyl-6-methoxyphenol hydroxylase-like FAD-dependent oxidoreductase